MPGYLRGKEPFPSLDAWRADGALFFRENLGARAGADIAAARLLSSIDSLDRSHWAATLLKPECSSFLLREPADWTWEELEDALEERPCRLDGPPEVLASPSARMLQTLRRSGKGSRGPTCQNAAFLSPGSRQFEDATQKLQAAIGLIQAMTPGYGAELAALVDCILLVDEHASFRGASGLTMRGAVMLSPEREWTAGVFAEELVHETTHTLLDLVSLRQPLLGGDEALEEKWSAPFRPDKRPLFGNFHALVVVARVVHLFHAFEEAGYADGIDWRQRALDYTARAQEPLAAIEAYPSLSPLAEQLLDLLVRPTLKER